MTINKINKWGGINGLSITYPFIISSVVLLMYPPSMRPGVSMMFNVNPALTRDTITGLGTSDFQKIKLFSEM